MNEWNGDQKLGFGARMEKILKGSKIKMGNQKREGKVI